MALMLFLATVIHLSFLGKKRNVCMCDNKKYAGIPIWEDFTGEKNDYFS